MRGKRAVEWRLVDEVVPPSSWEAKINERALELAARSDRNGNKGITLTRLQRIISDLRNSGIGILVTDHNVRETLAVTDRAYIINNGKIFRAGSPEALESDPEVRRVYLGENFTLNKPAAKKSGGLEPVENGIAPVGVGAREESLPRF